jgi:hypothetical protein
MNPVVLNVVGKDFTGDNFESSEEMRDEMMNIRTTFCTNPIKHNIYPIKDNHCVHTPYVSVIRPKDPRYTLAWNMCYRVGFITTCPIPQEKKDGKFIDKMSSVDFINTATIIENVFQVAIGLGHQVLILTPFGHEEDLNPIEDIIQIYNFCIMKYGHKLKSIIVAIPPYYPKNIFAQYFRGIIKPNEIVQEIDNKYDGLIVQKKIKEKLTLVKKNDTESETSTNSSENNNHKNLKENPNKFQGQMQMFMKLMQQNPKMMESLMKKNN